MRTGMSYTDRLQLFPVPVKLAIRFLGRTVNRNRCARLYSLHYLSVRDARAHNIQGYIQGPEVHYYSHTLPKNHTPHLLSNVEMKSPRTRTRTRSRTRTRTRISVAAAINMSKISDGHHGASFVLLDVAGDCFISSLAFSVRPRQRWAEGRANGMTFRDT